MPLADSGGNKTAILVAVISGICAVLAGVLPKLIESHSKNIAVVHDKVLTEPSDKNDSSNSQQPGERSGSKNPKGPSHVATGRNYSPPGPDRNRAINSAGGREAERPAPLEKDPPDPVPAEPANALRPQRNAVIVVYRQACGASDGHLISSERGFADSIEKEIKVDGVLFQPVRVLVTAGYRPNGEGIVLSGQFRVCPQADVHGNCQPPTGNCEAESCPIADHNTQSQNRVLAENRLASAVADAIENRLYESRSVCSSR